MAWKGAIKSFLGSGAVISMVGGIIVTGTYVVYTDTVRYPKMMSAFSRGNILPPLAENDHEVVYFRRHDIEATIRELLRPTFKNEYFFLNGPVGSGKTRLVIELVRDMIETDGRRGEGAPIYVTVNQGCSFPETLAQAVQFNFDEHISFKFFVDYVMRIHSLPSKDEGNKLVRVLDAIEKSSFRYMTKYGRPAVLVIDGLDSLAQSMPGALERVQEKAKLWADANSVKVVFVNNSDATTLALQRNSSNWSRAAAPFYMDDLTREETLAFLTSPFFMESASSGGRKIAAVTAASVTDDEDPGASLPLEMSERIYALVGGRIHHLLAFKRSWVRGVAYKQTAGRLMDREREKFVHVSRFPEAWKVIGLLRHASVEGESLMLAKMVKASSMAAVQVLLQCNLIRYERATSGMVVRFESRLTESVAEDLERTYRREKERKEARAVARTAREQAAAVAAAAAAAEEESLKQRDGPRGQELLQTDGAATCVD